MTDILSAKLEAVKNCILNNILKKLNHIVIMIDEH